MKKLLIIPLIALLSAAGVGFAASLNVTAEPVQAGGTSDLKCTQNAEVTWGFESDHATVSHATVAVNGACDDLDAYVYIDGVKVGSGATIANGTATVRFPAMPAAGINNVQVAIAG
ncbi:MAG: hypothetical protein JJE52_07885 [Acidimicrobiia bacterium]|nr:hypothetical protein [Acidimicrobiia bacterium]